MRRLLLLCFSISAFLLSCEPEAVPEPILSEEARTYLERVLDIMEEEAVYRSVIDWEAFRRRVIQEADGARETSNTYQAITLALSYLGDNHSFFIRPDGFSLFAPDRQSCQASPAGQAFPPSDIGYIKVPASSLQGEQANEFAQQLQEILRSQSESIDWVIDLRGNTGGNYYPMLAGIGPLLGAGLATSFIKPNGDTLYTFYQNGQTGIIFEGDTSISVEVADFVPDRVGLNKIAILLDGNTASSGEATALAFQGDPRVRTFGESTCGLTTSNEDFPLSDGAILILSTGIMANSDGTRFPSGISPQDSSPSGESTLSAAIRWLRE